MKHQAYHGAIINSVFVEGLRVFQVYTFKDEFLLVGRDARFVLDVVFQGSDFHHREHRDGVSSRSPGYNVDGHISCKTVFSEPVIVGGQARTTPDKPDVLGRLVPPWSWF